MSDAPLIRKAQLLDGAAMQRSLVRIAHEITERGGGAQDLVLVGIIRRGVPLAQRIAAQIERIEDVHIPVGSLDITFYRDDRTDDTAQPVLHETHIPFDITGKHVVLVDDVIYTGRTVRAAIDALFRLGRPSTVRLAVMIDRGLRELPFKPDYVGKNIPTSHRELVRVHVTPVDDEDGVCIFVKGNE